MGTQQKNLQGEGFPKNRLTIGQTLNYGAMTSLSHLLLTCFDLLVELSLYSWMFLKMALTILLLHVLASPTLECFGTPLVPYKWNLTLLCTKIKNVHIVNIR